MMEPVTPSQPVLLVPSWGATLPLMTISLMARDHYAVSLFRQSLDETCGQSLTGGSLRLMKRTWLYLESSHWLNWKYSYPGRYCIIAEPFRCKNCTTQVWGPFHVPRDTSKGSLCCHDGKVSLDVTRVELHRYEATKKSVRLRLNLDARNSCGTRFHVYLLDLGAQDCLGGTQGTAMSFGNDELLISKDQGFHDVPVNVSTLCAQVIPRCEECAFSCAASFHLLDLNASGLTESPRDIVISSGSSPILMFMGFWLGTTSLSCFLIPKLAKRGAAPNGSFLPISMKHTVIGFD
ncbi:uncharacterized protein LOC100907775 [Galendromus occidentalis]|uniref:Uncharacterized protein LOC100907775 n=1 Tax=Galendromus occidentalis TaxID=34638 RepID=A0AAJ6QMR6_9ACAR|nr:uncharacterized protein LOC100907775 [Galendromus occidentalis]